jgi:sugar-phosphatase
MKAAIFDMDGLLIDSEPLWRLAEQEVFATVGVHLNDTLCGETMGLRSDEVVHHWFQRFPWSDPSPGEVEGILIARMHELILHRGEAMPGVDEVLGQIHQAGLRLGLASSSPPLLIKAVLERLGIADRFEVTCSAIHEKRGKPDPAVYLTAAQQLGVEPKECLAFEDSLAGVRSACAAGMMVIAIPAHEQLGDPVFGEADLVLSSLGEFQIKRFL